MLLASVSHSAVVSDNPVDTTPHIVLDGGHKMYAFEQIGRTMYAGGKFDEVQDPFKTTTYARENFFAFDADTGVILPLNLSFNGTVTGIEASADESALFISGSFSQVNGITRRGIAKYDLVNNQIDPNFAPLGMRTVSDIELVDGALIAAGNFSKHLMAMDVTTGEDLGTIDLTVDGSVDPDDDDTKVSRIAISPDGTRLVATGNFTTVNGQLRKRAFMVNLGSTSTLSTWYAPRFEVNCNTSSRPVSAQGVDFSPDGSYFVIVATGGRGLNGICDAAARFETASVSSTVEPTWINWTGGDTLWSVAVTDEAVYVGGHQRWLDNTNGNNFPAPGAVDRLGIGAIDPVTGLALPWNPTKTRNEGTRVLFVTPEGLWAGSDGEYFGREDHFGIGFAPLDLSPTPDKTRPTTFIDSGPSGLVSETAATFRFSADESSTFQCRIDSATYAPCTSPVTFDNLSDGSHTFQVIAVDSSHNADATPAEQSWDVVDVGTELIGNTGFEVDTAGWRGDLSANALSRVAGGHSGGWAVEVSNSAAGGKCGLDDIPNWVSSTESGSYTASIWARSDTPGETLRLRVREYAYGARQGTASESLTLTSSWQQLTANYTPISPGSNLDLEVYTTNAPAGVCFQVDDASIKRDGVPPLVSISQSGGSTDVTEGGAGDSYTVVLDSVPTDNVNVTVTPDIQTDLGNGAGTAIVLSFTPAGALTPQVVNITAVDDMVDEGPHTSTVTHVASSADPNFDDFPIINVVAVVTDNDTAGVTVSQSGGSTDVTEGGAADNYTVVLNTNPTADVDVIVTPDSQTDLGSGAGTAIVLTLTTANWNVPQVVTVTAVDDEVFEGPHTSTIIHTSSSTDASYNGLTIESVVATIADNDTTSNESPIVDAGSDQTIELSDVAVLNATVSDDGDPDPPGAVETTWTQVTGPGVVTFGDSSSVDTTVSFSTVGTYVLRLTADDSQLTANDELTITVAADVVPLLYFTYTSTKTLPGGLTVDNEDIVSFDGNDYSLVFDGSDIGLSALKIDAIDLIDADEILISFTSSASLPGISQTVVDSDIVKFTATQLGDTTAGSFELFFDASDVGLDTSDVEAMELLDDGRLLISTKSDFSVPQFTGQEEDIIALTPTSLGETTAGSWSLYFDGNDVGLTGAGVDGIAVGDDGTIYLTSGGSFSVPGLSGKDEDVFVFHPSSLGDATAGTYDSTLHFDGSLHGVGRDVQAIDVSPIRTLSLDANGDGSVSAIDALVIINFLSSEDGTQGEGETPAQMHKLVQKHDSNGDGRVSVLDALQVINYLSRSPATAASEYVMASERVAVPSLDEVNPALTDSLDDDLLRLLANDRLRADQS